MAKYIHDGGYDSPHNAKITWKNHLQQESEWEGAMWGKNANFVGVEEFGSGERKPREIHDPGTYYEYNDVRINRFALSLARVFGKSLPEVLKENIMDPIGASKDWKWQGYGAKSTVEINGKPVESVSGGTRWGGGLVDQLAGSGALRAADSQSAAIGKASNWSRRNGSKTPPRPARTGRTTAICGG